MPPREPSKLVVLISGMTGTGKSTLARRLAEHYGLRYFSGGDALKEIAVRMGYRPGGPGWWETSEGLRFMKQRRGDPRFDREVDEWLVERAMEGNAVIDSWTLPWLYDGGFKIWLSAPEDVRARRVSKRDGMSVEEALRIIREKDEETKRIYREIYGFKLGEDLTPFHLIVDTEHLNQEEVFRVVRAVLDSYMRMK